MNKKLSRREALERTITGGMLTAATAGMSQSQLLALWQQGAAQAAKPTPSEVLGPFFMKNAPNQRLLRVAGEPGLPLKVSGKVTNTRGEKVEGAVVELWQADHAGLYDVVGYRYRAKLVLGPATEYEVDTILPGHYSDRPAQHIHYLISAPGHKTLITQAYFATDPWFDGDPDKNYNKRNLVGNRELVRPVRLYEGPGQPTASIDFHICLEKA
jgi:protocatechuate 3,4-dioxygenase beta subunit